MAVYPRRKKNGESVYWIDFYIPVGRGRDGRKRFKRVREKCGPSKRAAERKLKIRLAEVASGKRPDLGTSPVAVTVNELARTHYLPWAEAQVRKMKRAPRTLQRDRSLIDNLTAQMGATFVGKLGKQQVEAYQDRRLGDQMRPASVNREVALLKRMLNLAVEWNLATTNPIAGIDMLPEDNERELYLTQAQIEVLLAAASDWQRPLFQFALATGMRKDEILSLRWDWIKWDQGAIRIPGSATKNSDSRSVQINATVGNVLRATTRHIKSFLVFPTATGRKRCGSSFNESFRRAVRRAGLDDVEGLTFHVLRHTFASHMAMAGVDLLTLKELLGHKSLKSTLRYAHLASKHKAKAARLMDEVLGTSPATAVSDEVAVTPVDTKAAEAPSRPLRKGRKRG